MNGRILLSLLVTLTAFAANEQPRTIVIRDWIITIPAGTEDHKSDGPDFSVTYFIFPKLKSELGIYEGGWPQAFAKNQKHVVEQKDRIGGQDVAWSLWKEKTDQGEFARAEVFLVCAATLMPGTNEKYEEKFHIFLFAPDDKTLTSLQDVVRTLKRNEPNKAPEPHPPNGVAHL
jgi:hypothetical protein